MRLLAVDLSGRDFLVQYFTIFAEFGGKIPWLDGLDEMRFATNPEWFRDELLRRLGQRDGQLTPYQFVAEDQPRTFQGGILHFDRHPEKFVDRANADVEERLSSQGYGYISCLQVRTPFRSAGVGTETFRRALTAILKAHGSVWGVVSDARLLQWYIKLGASVHSPPSNKDHLWIVSWDKRTDQGEPHDHH